MVCLRRFVFRAVVLTAVLVALGCGALTERAPVSSKPEQPAPVDSSAGGDAAANPDDSQEFTGPLGLYRFANQAIQPERERLTGEGVVGLQFYEKMVKIYDDYIHRGWSNSELSVQYLKRDQAPYLAEFNKLKAARDVAGQQARADTLQRALEEERANFRKTGNPLLSKEGAIHRDSAGVPTLGLTVKNVSSKAIDAFQVRIHCYDRYGKAVGRYGRQDNVFRGQAQDVIAPGETTTTSWYLHGFDLVARGRIRIESVHYQDGTVWKNASGARFDFEAEL